MESACLHLRFTPLLQNIYRDHSKCCLEIVPEVSYMENFENIQWKHGDNFIEYTIPVTYKVILKKKEIIRKLDNDLENKIYHSCVDLLIPSSLTNINHNYSNITKITSDTFISRKTSTEVDKANVSLLTLEKSNSNIMKTEISQGTRSQKDGVMPKEFSVNLNEMNDIYDPVVENVRNKDVSSQVIQVVNIPSNNSKYSLIGTSSECLICNRHTSTDIISSVTTRPQSSSNGSKSETKHKLSLTPVYSINTEDNILDVVRTMTSNIFVIRVSDSKIIDVVSMDKINNIMYENYPNKISYDLSLQPRKPSNRILPEVRIAQLMQAIKKEILPLKRMLDDIIHNCSSLGFNWKEIEHQNYKLCNSCVSRFKSDIRQYYKTESKCNRVVYSMVFDE